jgi:flagellar M-ring protein FliF
VLAASAIGLLLVVFFMVRLATQPSYTMLNTGLDPAETGKLTSALDAKGIKYELRNNGTALAVEESQTADARIALAEKGLPRQGTPGFELFDKQKLGASDMQQKVTYQRALEGEIANTIDGIKGAEGARVDLVLPEDQLFQDKQSEAKAAVLIPGDGQNLESGSVRGIAQLVSSGVKGLKTENVTITDGSGRLLWPNGDSSGGDGMGATSKVAAQRRYEQELEGSLNAMIARTLGPGKGEVQVAADLNTDKATREELRYAKKGTPLKQQSEKESLKGGGAGAGGAAGAVGNIPSYATGGAGGAGSQYTRKSSNTDFGVDKQITHTQIAPGAVQKLNVALLVDKKVPPADVRSLQKAVGAAAGIDKKRGDAMQVSRVGFTGLTPVKGGGSMTNILGYAKYVLLGFGMLGFLVFLGRHLRRRENEELADPTWLREIQAPRSLAELEYAEEDTVAMAPPTLPPSEELMARRRVEDLVDQEPERVAQQVRAWMKEE